MANNSVIGERSVVRESEVLARTDHHLEALVVDERPETLVADPEPRRGTSAPYGRHSLNEIACIWSCFVAASPYVKEPCPEHVFVGAISWGVSQHRSQPHEKEAHTGEH